MRGEGRGRVGGVGYGGGGVGGKREIMMLIQQITVWEVYVRTRSVNY